MMRVTTTAWPNKLGFDCSVNGIEFEVSSDRQCGRLSASVMIEGERGTYIHLFRERGATWPAADRDVAIMVYESWQNYPLEWIQPSPQKGTS